MLTYTSFALKVPKNLVMKLVFGMLAFASVFAISPSATNAAITVDPGAMPVTGFTQWPNGSTASFASTTGVQFQIVRNVRATSTNLRLLYLNNTNATTTFMASTRKGFYGTSEMVTVSGTTTIVIPPYSSATSDVLSFSANSGEFIYDRTYIANPVDNQVYSSLLIPGTYNPDSISTPGSYSGSNAVAGWATTTTNMLMVSDKSFETRIPFVALNQSIYGAYAVLGIPADSALKLTTFVGDSKTTDALPDTSSGSKPWPGRGMGAITGAPYQNLGVSGDSLRYFVRPQEYGNPSSYALRLSLLAVFGGDVVNHYGTNSVGNGTVPSTSASSELGYISELKTLLTASSPTSRLFQATLDSVTRKSATSSWTTVTEADQTGGGDNNNGVATSVYINNIFKTNKPSYIDGVINLASVTMTPNGYWLPNMTGDGIHQNNNGNAAQGTLFRSLWPVATTTQSVSSIAATSTASTTATITWSTALPASRFVNFGLLSSYTASTTEAATSSRATSHSVSLSNLRPCTKYNFQVDGYNNYYVRATSTNQSFITIGCTGAATVATSSDSNAITTASGGTFVFGTSTIVVPTSFTSTSTSAVFQAKQLDQPSFVAAAGIPSGKTQAGTYVLNLTALVDATTTLSTFNQPISVTLSYVDSDIAGLDAATLKIYRYDAGTGWALLDNCTRNAGAKTVTCTTTHFSDFAIFGDLSAVSSGGYSTQTTITGGVTTVTKGGVTTVYGTANASAVSATSTNSTSNGTANTTTAVTASNNAAASSTSPTAASSAATVTTTATATPVTLPKNLFTKNFKLGSIDEGVRSLQKFLNSIGFTVSLSGAGSSGHETSTFGLATQKAVIKFQKVYKITPTIGFFGPVTRGVVARIK